MLYYLFEYLENNFQLLGASLFQYLSFRASLGFILALLISLIFGKRIIHYLKDQQVNENIRDLGLEGQKEKEGTPTMGGIIILISLLVPVILVAKLENIYILILLFTTLWTGFIGWIDDYIKIFKKDKKGLQGKFKILGQFILGAIVGGVLYFHPMVTVRTVSEKVNDLAIVERVTQDQKGILTTIPLLKNNEFDYADLIGWTGLATTQWGWTVFIPIVIFIIMAVSNGANLTDGIDGLAAGSSAIIVIALAIFAWVSGNIIFSDYLNIMYIPNVGEVTVFIASFVGALVGFLWYNSFPASIFMGDTGSLTIGALIAVLAIIVRKELLIPILCGIFLIENLSVILQVSYFKYSKRKTGEGKRLFLMSPFHHHFQKKGYHESKIVARFWIVGILLAIVSIVTLKIR